MCALQDGSTFHQTNPSQDSSSALALTTSTEEPLITATHLPSQRIFQRNATFKWKSEDSKKGSYHMDNGVPSSDEEEEERKQRNSLLGANFTDSLSLWHIHLDYPDLVPMKDPHICSESHYRLKAVLENIENGCEAGLENCNNPLAMSPEKYDPVWTIGVREKDTQSSNEQFSHGDSKQGNGDDNTWGIKYFINFDGDLQQGDGMDGKEQDTCRDDITLANNKGKTNKVISWEEKEMGGDVAGLTVTNELSPSEELCAFLSMGINFENGRFEHPIGLVNRGEAGELEDSELDLSDLQMATGIDTQNFSQRTTQTNNGLAIERQPITSLLNASPLQMTEELLDKLSIAEVSISHTGNRKAINSFWFRKNGENNRRRRIGDEAVESQQEIEMAYTDINWTIEYQVAEGEFFKVPFSMTPCRTNSTVDIPTPQRSEVPSPEPPLQSKTV